MSAVKYSIGIFDDHPVVTEGLKNLFAGDRRFGVGLIAHTRKELLTGLSNLSLDVLLLDVVAPDVTGLELFSEIRKDFPEQKFAAYSTLSSPILVENILMAGASGYLNKRQSGPEIREALIKICEGEKYVPPDLEFLLRKKPSASSQVKISPREIEILKLIIEGKLSKEIADQLAISLNTVENHRANLFRKFDVKNIAELIRQATRLGYIAE